MTLDDLINGSIKNRTLTPEGVGPNLERTHEVFHHEWAKAKKNNHTTCVIIAGDSPLAFVLWTMQQSGLHVGSPILEAPFDVYLHDLEGGTFIKASRGDMDLEFIET